MPESRGRRPKKPTPQGAGSTAANTPTKTTEKEKDSPREATTGFRLLELWKNVWAVLGPAVALTWFAFLLWPLELWKNVWAVLGPAVALTWFAILLWPQVRIEPSSSLDSTDALTTQFRVTNTGNVPVYEIRFGCSVGIGAAYTHLGHVQAGAASLATLAKLAAGNSVTRSCVISSSGSDIPNMQITATFEWPLIPWSESKTAFFRVVRSATGAAVLLPDLAPGR